MHRILFSEAADQTTITDLAFPALAPVALTFPGHGLFVCQISNVPYRTVCEAPIH